MNHYSCKLWRGALPMAFGYRHQGGDAALPGLGYLSVQQVTGEFFDR